jgi:hypothetical protein
MSAGTENRHRATYLAEALSLPNPLVVPAYADAQHAHRGLAALCALIFNTVVVALATYGAWSLAGAVIEDLSR